jgi:hypothetical protein
MPFPSLTVFALFVPRLSLNGHYFWPTLLLECSSTTASSSDIGTLRFTESCNEISNSCGSTRSKSDLVKVRGTPRFQSMYSYL